MIQKLSEEVINQIAAGEVIERPSSVIKELLDNAIDSQATRIDIKVKGGGKKYIEVSDNGIGIDKDDLQKVFEAHTTSKIKNIEDLNDIISMGFRGEALSTVVSISNIEMISKKKDGEFAYKVIGKGIEISNPEKTARDTGTTLIVKDLFLNIPARLKYLRADDTEYRKILETVIPYFLIYPNIHFTFSNNGKQIYNLPKVFDLNNRIGGVLKGEFLNDMLKIYYEGEGVKIDGVLAQPRYVFDRTQYQYFFLNNRCIQDRGIVKAVSEGCSGFIPNSKRIPFLINLQIKPSLVDVNVHPRKEEVRFMNPYRVYSAVQGAIKESLKDYSKEEVSSIPQMEMKDKPRKVKEVNYRKSSDFSIESGLRFSEQLLKPKVLKQTDMSLFKKEEVDMFKCFQIFNKYIVVEFENDLWVVDQHAASERINYERLKNNFNVQPLLLPIEIKLSEIDESFLKENVDIFHEFGFKLQIKKNILEVLEIPDNLSNANLEKFFSEIFAEQDVLKKMSDLKEKVLSVIACHSSVRTGQRLSEFEMKGLIKDLKRCLNSISCPHGRPIIWKLKLGEVDKKFYRNV